MVYDRIRRPAHYPLNIWYLSSRLQWKSACCLQSIALARISSTRLCILYGIQLSSILICCFGCLEIVKPIINPNIIASSVRIDIFLVNFNDHQRYYIRVKNPCFIQRLIAAFHNLENIIIYDKWYHFMPAWSRRSFSNAIRRTLAMTI